MLDMCVSSIPPRSPLVVQVVQLSSLYSFVYPFNNEAAALNVLATRPLIHYFSVNARFMQYSGGVFSDPTCNTTVNHG